MSLELTIEYSKQRPEYDTIKLKEYAEIKWSGVSHLFQKLNNTLIFEGE